MAEVISLPVRISSAGTAELIALLTKAAASGADLGPRGPQIRCVGHSLQHLVDDLRTAVEKLATTLSPDDGKAWHMKMLLEKLCDIIEALIKQSEILPHRL